MFQKTNMERFEYTELTLTSDKVYDDSKSVDVSQLNLVSVESFDTCNMSVFQFKREVVGHPWNKPVLMPSSSLSWQLGRKGARLHNYQEGEMTNPDHPPIKIHRKKNQNFFIISLQQVKKWVPPSLEEDLSALSKFQYPK